MSLQVVVGIYRGQVWLQGFRLGAHVFPAFSMLVKQKYSLLSRWKLVKIL